MAGLQHHAILDIGAALDEAVLDAERWPSLIADVARASGSEGVILLRADKAVSSALSTPSMEAVTARYYAEGWNKIDHRYKGVPLIRTRGVAVDQDFTAPDEFERLPYYQEFMARHGLRWFAGVGFQTGGRFWCVTIQRTVAQGPFEPREQRSLLELSPALRRAALLTAATDGARLAGMTEALDLVGRPAAVLGEGGRVLRHNAAFERLLGDDLSILRGRLSPADPDAARGIERLASGRAPPGIALVTARRREGRPLVLHAVPLAGPTRLAFAGGTCLLIAGAPDGGPAVGPSVLTAAFRLTRREAALAVALAKGASPAEAAERLGIAYGTARVHIRSIFDKLGVRRQAELVRLLAALPGPDGAGREGG